MYIGKFSHGYPMGKPFSKAFLVKCVDLKKSCESFHVNCLAFCANPSAFRAKRAAFRVNQVASVG